MLSDPTESACAPGAIARVRPHSVGVAERYLSSPSDPGTPRRRPGAGFDAAKIAAIAWHAALELIGEEARAALC